MAETEKELEEQLLVVGNKLLAPLSDVEELLPLLDEAESLLSKVEQSPNASMSAALDPTMKALVAKELLKNSDMDVKVAVASCISEVTRITAPDAPFDDELMKEIFEMIVEAFKGLDDISGRSYSKRVSILETVAKVRSCVVMLDLECDGLILDMFHIFLDMIRENHSENVFSLMETIMTVVLEESEEISLELLSSLLSSVKKDNKDLLPAVRTLGEKVIGNCGVKLKPYLLGVIRSTGTSLTDYSRVIASICEENSDVHGNLKVSGECMEDDSKLSERTVSEDLPQGDAQAGCLEEIGTGGKLPKSLMSNGSVHIAKDNSLVKPASPNRKPDEFTHCDTSKRTVASTAKEADNQASVTSKTGPSSDQSSKRAKTRKAQSSIHSKDATDQSQIHDGKEAIEVSGRAKSDSKGADDFQAEGHSGEKPESAAPIEHEKNSEVQVPVGSDNETTSIASPITSESPPGTITRSKRGRPPRSKSSSKGVVNAATDLPALSLRSKKGSPSDQTAEERGPSKNTGSNKKVESTSDSEDRPLRHFSKKGHARTVEDDKRSTADTRLIKEAEGTTNSKAKAARQAGKKKEMTGKGEFSEQLEAHRGRSRKGRVASEKNVSGEKTLKEMASSPKIPSKAKKDQSPSEENLKTKSRRKRARGAEISETAKTTQNLDEKIVGSNVKVWWPDDKQFYEGVIDAYYPATKKHKVSYADGDVELLCLKDEKWEFVDGESVSDEEGAGNARSVNTSEMQPKKKKTRPNPDSATRESEDDIPLKRVGSKHGSDVIRSSANRKSTVASRKPGNKLKERTGGMSKDYAPKSGKNLKENSGNKSKEETSKAKTELGDDSPKTGKKSRNHTPRTGSKGKYTVEKDSGEGSLKVGRRIEGSKTPKSSSKLDANGSSKKGMISSLKSGGTGGSVKAKGSSRKRRRSIKS